MRIIWFVCAMALVISSCSNEETASGKDKALEKEVVQLQKQVRDLQSKLDEQSRAIKVNTMVNEQDPGMLEWNIIKEKYPKLEKFLGSQQFEQIELKYTDDQGTYVVTDKALLDSMASMIIIKRRVSLGSPPISDIRPVDYLLTTAQGTVRVNITQLGLISFPELYPNDYFETDPKTYQLAKGLLNPPRFVARDEPILSKMIQSGFMKIVQGDAETPGISFNRMYIMVTAFDQAKKQLIDKPKTVPTPMMKLTFLYYGEELEMNLYDGMVQIKDHYTEQWFKTDEDEALYTNITAG